MPDRPRCFAIIFTGREGSSYVETAINNHPEASCFGEIMCHGSLFERNWNRDYRGFLTETLHSMNAKAVGFKLPWMTIAEYADIFDFLREEDYSVILMQRQNTLDQLISCRLALASGAWASNQKSNGTTAVEISAETAIPEMRSLVFQRRMLNEATRSFRRIIVDYDDILSIEMHLQVCDFLGLTRQSLVPSITRQRVVSRRDAVTNYDELVAGLAGTEFAGLAIDGDTSDATTLRP